MLTYENLIASGAITESVARLVFSDDTAIQDNMLATRSLVRSSFRICLFYTTLIQAYIIGKAINSDCTINELDYPSGVIEQIKLRWSFDEQKMSDSSGSVISFLKDCAANGKSDLMDESAAYILRAFNEMYQSYESNARTKDQMGDNDFILLLKAFPLLSKTEIDFQNKKFCFLSTDGMKFEMSCSPFVFFFNRKTNSIVQNKTDEILVFTSLKKSERNGELSFHVSELQISEYAKWHVETIHRKIAKDENLYMICKAVELDTDWYEIDECYCDLAFLEYLNRVNYAALKKFFKQSSKQLGVTRGGDILPGLLDIFFGCEEMLNLLNRKKEIHITDTDKLFYELYINCGIFKTMCELFRDHPEHEFSDSLFTIYMNEFVLIGKITEAQRDAYISECNANISIRLKKLSEIVSNRTRQYDLRKRSITAEWRAYCVLKVAGIRDDKLFTDEEAILSIDDYFDMIKNPSTTIKSDLNSVLAMVTELYGALLENDIEFDEQKYAESLKRIREENKLKDTADFFEYFIEIIKNSENNKIINKHIGRNSICDVNTLQEYAEEIQKLLCDTDVVNSSQIVTRKSIFISYAHKDIDRVKKYVDKWTAQNYNIFFDEEKFVGGDIWRKKAARAIHSEDCAAVFVFMSKNAAVSEPVRFELDFAKNEAVRRFSGYKNSDELIENFIVPINLEDEEIGLYLSEILNMESLKDGDDRTDVVVGIRQIISSQKIFYSYKTDMETKVSQRIKELLLSNSAEEYNYIEKTEYTGVELEIANFYGFLKFGNDHTWQDADKVVEAFKYGKDGEHNVSKCIFPLIASVKETKIKRDSIALVAYEIISGKGETDRGINYILTSKRLSPDDYYCVPNYRTMGDDCSWMVNPLLISHDLFLGNAGKGK